MKIQGGGVGSVGRSNWLGAGVHVARDFSSGRSPSKRLTSDIDVERGQVKSTENNCRFYLTSTETLIILGENGG